MCDFDKWMGGLLFGWWIHDRWVKTCLRGVLSSYPTPMFISRAIMKKSIFENFEILLFWAIFTVFLGYFPYCKNSPKIRFFGSRFFGWECWGVKPMFSGGHFGLKRPPENIGLTPQHSQPKKFEIQKIGFFGLFLQ